MHLSLKGSMDRQPLTDRLGDRLLAEYGGAAAAYSLRALNGNGDSVVRVRRASDNDEKDFTAEQIELGEMVNWVNSQTVPPLDIGVETSEGRIPVPEGGTSIGIPAAAYSLRNLSTTYTGNVVDVRRSSDDAEDSFTATEVADGTLTDWVNEIGVIRNRTASAKWTTVTPTATGFDAATTNVGACGYDLYGSSGDSVTVTFDVLLNSGSFSVQLRDGFESGSSVSNSEIISTSGSKSFTLTSSADFVALQFISASADIEVTNFSINTPWTNDGFVTKWYDQSGNDNHATQGIDASQPKIVDGGSLVTKLGQPSMDFTTGSTMLLSDSFSITETESAVFAIWQPAQDSATTVQSRNRTLFGNASSQIYIGTPNADSQMSFKRFDAVKSFTLGLANLNTPNLHAFVGTTAGADYYFNGSSIYSDTATGTNSIRNHLRIGAKQNLATHDTEGYISELIIYDSDQSANRTAIEANIGETYGITGIPAYDNTVDGFVETWYDQSGNGNDATQSVAASQPKIVDGGSLVSGGIDFDGLDDFFELGNLGLSQPNSVVFVHNSDTSGGSNVNKNDFLDGTSQSTGRTLIDQLNASYRIFAGVAATTSKTIVANQDALVFTTLNGSSSKFSLDGSNQTGLNVGTNGMDEMTLGASISGGRYDGKFAEFIIYPSDQSANRVGIETNINDHYNIY
jgi:hypothetical protein